MNLQSSLRACVVMKCPSPLFHGTNSPKFLDLRKEKLSSRWKTGLQFSGQGASQSRSRPFVVKVVEAISELNKVPADMQEKQVNTEDKLQSRSMEVSFHDLKQDDPKEYKRRRGISRANKGRVAWNKGKRHSPETIMRIQERTREAMQHPKGRKKLEKSHYYHHRWACHGSL